MTTAIAITEPALTDKASISEPTAAGPSISFRAYNNATRQQRVFVGGWRWWMAALANKTAMSARTATGPSISD